jgi:hypothetical protein
VERWVSFRFQRLRQAVQSGFLMAMVCAGYPASSIMFRRSTRNRRRPDHVRPLNILTLNQSKPFQTSTVCKICTFANLDDIAVGVADVAADLAVLGLRLGDEFGSAAFP